MPRTSRPSKRVARSARASPRGRGTRLSMGSQDLTSGADESHDHDDTDSNDDDAVERTTKAPGRETLQHPTTEEDEEMKDAEESEEEPRRHVARPPSVRATNRPEVGVIEEIYCENFMCHRKLRVQLSPHINFITGENGSGKSAVIAAIQICLGASARTTHRGKSIKHLIRHGHDGHALVRVTLRNDGDSDAFRPQAFGKAIHVERLLRRDGSAEYRLKTEHGVLVSKLKHDVELLLDHFNIQTDNPCAILDQENAKLFLQDNAAAKYEFFLKATDLFKLRNSYRTIDESTRYLSETVLVQEQHKVAALRDARDQAAQRSDEAKGLALLEEECEQLKQQLAWSFVVAKEREVAAIEAALLTAQRKHTAAQVQHDDDATRVAALEAKQLEKNSELETLTVELQRVQRERENATREIRDARRPLDALEAQQKHMALERTRTVARRERLQRDLETKRRAHDDRLRLQPQAHERQRLLASKRDELADLERALAQAEQQALQSASREVIDQLEQQFANCVRVRRETEHALARLEDRRTQLQAQRGDALALYGHKIPQLQRAIAANVHHFTAPPIGPMGRFVALPVEYQRFAVAIDVALSGALFSYLVVNGRDKALLEQLKQHVDCPPYHAAIVIAPRASRRYSPLDVAPGTLTRHAISSLLEVTDDHVFNALVDAWHMERKLVYDDRVDAERATLRGPNHNLRWTSPAISEVYLPSGDRFRLHDGSLSYIANKQRARRNVLLRPDVNAELQALTSRLDTLQRTHAAVCHDHELLRRAREAAAGAARHEADRLNQLTRRVHQRRVELRTLEDELHDETQQRTLDTSVLDDEVREATQELDALAVRDAELRARMASTTPQLTALRQVVQDCTTTIGELTHVLTLRQRDASAVYNLLSDAKATALCSERAAAAAQQSVAATETQLATARAECTASTAKAAQWSEDSARLDVTETPAFYGQRLSDMTRTLAAQRDRVDGMDVGALVLDMNLKTAKYADKHATHARFAAHLGVLQGMLKARAEALPLMRETIAANATASFAETMAQYDFAAKLKFRHATQRLDIAVVPHVTGSSGTTVVTDTKQLSGGERSITQVALLLALGTSIECPFRVLDEFDVFMDAVNRDMAIQLLVDGAKRAHGKQFVFVTPNDLSTLRRDPMVKVLTMDAPRDRRTDTDQQQ